MRIEVQQRRGKKGEGVTKGVTPYVVAFSKDDIRQGRLDK
jgi:hypothetical protein